MARKPLPSGDDDNWESLEAELFGVEYGKEHRPAELPESGDDISETDAVVEFDDSAADFDAEPQDNDSNGTASDDSLVEFEEEEETESFSDSPVAEDFDSTGVHPTSEPPRPTADDPYWDALSDWNWDDPNSTPARAAGNESDDGGVAPPRADRAGSDRSGTAAGRRDDRSGGKRGRGGRGRDDRRGPRPPRSTDLPSQRPVSPVDEDSQPVSERPVSDRPGSDRPATERPVGDRPTAASRGENRAERPERSDRHERGDRAERTTGERSSGERPAGERSAGTPERTERPRRDDGRRDRGGANRRGAEPAEPRAEEGPRSDAGRGGRRGERPRTPPVVPAAVEFDDDDFGGGIADEFSPVRPVSESRHPADDLDDTNGDDLFGDDSSPLADDASDMESPLEGTASADDRPRRRRRRRGRGRGRGGRPGDAVVSGSGDEAEDGFGPDDSPVAEDSDDFAADERDIDPRAAEDSDDPWSDDRPAERTPAGGRRGGRGGRGGRDDRGGNRGPRTERPSRPVDFGPDDDSVDDLADGVAAVAKDDDDDDDFEPAVNYSNVPTWEEAISYLLNPQLVQVDARESGSAPKGGIPQVDRPEPRAPERSERPEPRGEQRPPEPRSDRPRGGGQRPHGRRRN